MAAGAAATETVTAEQSELECSVCNEHFADPKLLPCGHLLCHHCVLSWLRKQPNAGCPLCRHPIGQDQQLGSGKVNLESIAVSLPTDLAMQGLVEAERLLNKQHQCQICEDVKATFICLHCGDFFCQACTKGHKKSTSTKHHVVEEIASLTPYKLSAKRSQEPCFVHADKTSEVFCSTHSISVCLLCATTNHRKCPEVTSLEEKMAEAQRVLQELADTLRAGEAKLERELSELDQHMDQVEKKTKAALTEIEDACNRLESAVKACRLRLKKLTQATCDDARERLNAGKAVLLGRQGRLKTHTRVVERAQDIKSRCKIGTMTHTLQTRIQELNFSAALPLWFKNLPDINLTIDSKVVKHIERLLQSGLAELTCQSSKPSVQFSFHPNCGHDIELSNNQLTAEKMSSLSADGGLLLGRQPMEVNYLYEIIVEKIWGKFKGLMLPVGVLAAHVDDVTLPPSGNATEPIWTSAVVLLRRKINSKATEVSSDLGSAVSGMPNGSRVGISLDENRDLLLYFNGKLKGTIASALPDPVYPLFNLNHRYKKITALPVTPMA